ncbi:TauD/TfdA family dioxygenase [Mesorhizobium sp. Cs1299R1N1]|uniref:TauD/TfdA family dioxygenase n=1 Tax=Mesorhizobium sp. Cs1299R1N1 TaxID=3015172 RepID=UPI00301CB6F6
MNTMHSVQARKTFLAVTFSSGEIVGYPWLWLKDNAPSAFHPVTEERVFDLTSVDTSLRPLRVEEKNGVVRIVWSQKDEEEFPRQFFESYRPGKKRNDPADIAPILWDGSIELDSIPGRSAGDIFQDDAGLLVWLKATAAYGLSIVDSLADDPDAGRRMAERIGFRRQTNFGTMFEVVSMPNPNNLAYTPVALPLHTDLANQELPPGYQFLHCIANGAEGGGSIFADGFAVVAALQTEDPEAYRLLCEIEIPYRFHDREYDLRGRFPVIVTNRRGEVTELRFNAHLVDVIDLPSEICVSFYAAYRKLMMMIRSPRFRISYRLKAGEMAVFDNRRVLHGREAFNPNTGRRHLRGCYVDRGEFLSRIRVLSR